MLTSGRISPHLLHFVRRAFVRLTSSDHLTPVNARFFAVCRRFAHKKPCRRVGGVPPTNPGEMVQT